MATNSDWWDWEISSKARSSDLNLKNLLSYQNLLKSLVKRDFLLHYQQTVLGPVWILFQPVLTLFAYIFVFGRVIGVRIGSNVPEPLFYFSGIILWNFFNESFNSTSRTFRDNIHLFSKVYFPRIIMPLSAITTQLFRLSIQLVLFFILTLYFVLFKSFTINLGWFLLGFPVAIILVGFLALSVGLIFSVITAKYRDLSNGIDIFIRLLIFATPVFYPLSAVKPAIRWVVNLNPLTPLFELFRFSFFGSAAITPFQLVYSAVFIMLSFVFALLLFNKQGIKLIDVV